MMAPLSIRIDSRGGAVSLRAIVLVMSLMMSATGFAAENWVTEGFEAFRRGTFGNAGQNVYVSKAGVLQRIHLFDLDHNGYLDLPFANCQDHHEAAPSYVYAKDGSRVATLPGQGARSGVVADLNGDGFQDLVVCGYFDMVSPFSATDIYFGHADGTYSSKRHIRLQSPHAQDCCVGRLDGRRPALVFALTEHGVIRIYSQTELGFEWRKFTDIDFKADLVTATDLDGDGFDDLCVRMSDTTETTVFWGSEKGIDGKEKSVLPALPSGEILSAKEEETLQSELERKYIEPRRLESVSWRGRKAFSLSTGKKMFFYSATKGRRIERIFEIDVPMAQAVATGDLNGDGYVDLVFACQAKSPVNPQGQCSYVYLGSDRGFRAEDRIAVETRMACAVDVSGNEMLFAQCAAGRSYTNDALLFSFRDGKLDDIPRRYSGENMHRAFFVENPGQEKRIFLVNHYSRSSVGYDKAFVYWGDKTGYDRARRTEVPAWCGVDTLPADLDDDGWAELLVCNNSENSLHLDPGLFIHKFGPEGFEPEKSRALRTDVGWGVIVADFDRDGYLDIISSCDHWYGLRYFHGGSDGFKRHEDIEVQLDPNLNETVDQVDTGGRLAVKRPKNVRHAASGHARWPIAVDVNMDGWLDLVVPLIYEDRSYVLWGGPNGFSRENRMELSAFGCVSARAADLDGNGYPEVILGAHATQVDGNVLYRNPHHSYVHIYWNGPQGLSEANKAILRCDAGDSMSIADYNRDGTLDIFVGSYQGEIDRELNSYIYWNRGGSFEEFDRQELVTHVVSGCISADFNEDGWIDLAAANHKVYGDHVGESYVWWNGPHGFCSQNVTKLPTCGPHGICTYEPGNQLTRGPAEFYYSEIRRVNKACVLADVCVEGDVPNKTWVKLKVRKAADERAIQVAEWMSPENVSLEAECCLQYRLELGAINGLRTPRVKRVTLRFQ